MPYASNRDLPEPVRSALPPRAQRIFRAAFNSAYSSYAGNVRREEIAHRIAWAAVKKCFVKRGENWVERPERQRHARKA